MNKADVILILDLLTHASKLKPKVIPDSMINIKRTLDIGEKIKVLRESKSIPPDYLELFEFINDIEKQTILATTLLQILSYISSTNKSEIVLNKFKKGKVKSFDEKSSALSVLLKEAQDLLKYLKSAKEVEDNLQDETKKVSRSNSFKKILALEKREEKIAEAVDIRIASFFQQLKETKASVASMGMR